MFQDEEFSEALAELDNPRLDDYEFFVECLDVKIYRKFIEASGLYEYKVTGFLDCDTAICQEVYMDLEYRKIWDSYVKELYETKKDGVNVIYWNVNYPFPMSNRDYTYIRECRRIDQDDKPTWVILARSHKVDSIPDKPKVIRVNEYKQFLIIQKDEEKKTRAFMHYYDNPGGSIPTWLINWAAKKGVPAFLTDMKKACLGYSDYLVKNS